MRRRCATVVTVATPGEWRAAARNGEWAQHFSNASCLVIQYVKSKLLNLGLSTRNSPTYSWSIKVHSHSMCSVVPRNTARH